MHSDGDGLYLKVQKQSKSITKSWLLRWGAGGKNTMGLGPYPEVTLAKARELAFQQRQIIAAGGDPRVERNKAKQEVQRQQSIKTFEDHAKDLIAKRRPTWKNSKHAQQWESTLETYAYPVIGNKAIDQITLSDIRKILDPIWSKKQETAERVRGRIEVIIDAAMTLEDRPVINHAKWKGRLEHVLPPSSKAKRVQHHPALKYADLPVFCQQVKAIRGITSQALQFTILTACRTNEIIGASWEEINLQERLWIIPKERMKKDKEHRVPLSQPAVELLEKLKANQLNDWVFPSPKGINQHISNMAMLTLLKKNLKRLDITVHGFRSTFRDWAGEASQHSREVIEHALAHQLANQAEAAYQRGDYLKKRQQLMEDWGRYVTQPSTLIP